MSRVRKWGARRREKGTKSVAISGTNERKNEYIIVYAYENEMVFISFFCHFAGKSEEDEDKMDANNPQSGVKQVSDCFLR